LFVYDLTDGNGDRQARRHLGHVFNPRIKVISGFVGTQDGTVGCLSRARTSGSVAPPGQSWTAST
jgi:hypothetical protein